MGCYVGCLRLGLGCFCGNNNPAPPRVCLGRGLGLCGGTPAPRFRGSEARLSEQGLAKVLDLLGAADALVAQ